MESTILLERKPDLTIKKELFKYMLNDFLNSREQVKHVRSLSSQKNLFFFKGYIPGKNNGFDFQFGITDKYNLEKYKLITTISNSTVYFDLKTKSTTNDKIKHPDMFSYEFIDFTLNSLIPQKKLKVNCCTSQWCKYSDNYIQFLNALKNGASEIDAIKSTWTAKALSSFGYDKILRYKVKKPVDEGILVTTVYGKN